MKNNKKLYEIECHRSNITPKEFFNYCKKTCHKKGVELEGWLDGFEEWSTPYMPYDTRTTEHKDGETSYIETTKILPYNFHLFYEKFHNFYLEFDFYTDKKGFGYFYVVEYDR